MKKWILLLLSGVLILSGCQKEEGDLRVTAGEITAAVADSQTGEGPLNALSGEMLEGYLTSLGLEAWEDASVFTGEGMDGREITVVRLADEGEAETAACLLEEHRQKRIADFFGYAPEQVTLLENAGVLTCGKYAAFLACDDAEGATAAFERCVEGDVQAVQPAPSPALDISGFPHYRQPNHVDMTLYDTTPVVTAWQTGEETELSDKDRAVLDRCREVFDEIITEEMTDFEKELALHDWIIANGSYDAQSRDNVAHIGQPDNTNPYGMLVGGYGICLGFAETFRLFMELADIPCVTVVGAAYDSQQDHAWNLVKLDGEWYCVDMTWDNSGESYAPKERPRMSHAYFNVTSDRLRETNHQWDYMKVPEATATKYRWDGVSQLPE